MTEEKILRFAEPEIYQKMIDIFSAGHIHPYDVQASIKEDEHGYELALTFSANHSQRLTTRLCPEKGNRNDEELNCFFAKAADVCKSLLMADLHIKMKA